MKILKKLSKPILLLLLIFTCVFMNKTNAYKEIADIMISGRKQYTLFSEFDKYFNWTEVRDNDGNRVLLIMLGEDTLVDKYLREEQPLCWHCIDYRKHTSIKERLIIKPTCYCAYIGQQCVHDCKYIAWNESSKGNSFSFKFHGAPTSYVSFKGNDEFVPVSLDYNLLPGTVMLSYEDIRIVRTSAANIDPLIPVIVCGMLHQ